MEGGFFSREILTGIFRAFDRDGKKGFLPKSWVKRILGQDYWELTSEEIDKLLEGEPDPVDYMRIVDKLYPPQGTAKTRLMADNGRGLLIKLLKDLEDVDKAFPKP